MRYVSSRGGVPPTSFGEALLAGYCADGGLYVPESMPQMGEEWLAGLASADFVTVAEATLRLFIGEEEVTNEELRQLVRAAFATFHHPEVLPVVALRPAAQPARTRAIAAFHAMTEVTNEEVSSDWLRQHDWDPRRAAHAYAAWLADQQASGWLPPATRLGSSGEAQQQQQPAAPPTLVAELFHGQTLAFKVHPSLPM
jgi:threonine synthase